MRRLWRVAVIVISCLIPLALFTFVGELTHMMRWQLGSPLLSGYTWFRWSHAYLVLGGTLCFSLYVPVIASVVKKKQKLLLIPLIASVAFVLFSILFARISQRVYLTQRMADMDAEIARNPTDSTAVEAKANAYADLGDYDKAIALYSKALETTATPAYVLHDRGMAYMGKGEYAQAVDDLTQALHMNTNEKRFVAQYYNDRAVVYFRSGQYAQSWQDVEKALELGYQVHPGFLAELEKKGSRQQDNAGHGIIEQESPAYFGRIQHLIIERAKQSPQLQASPNDWVNVSFVLRRTGAIEDVRIKESSGNQSFEQEALKIVTDTAPFPPFPQSIKENQRQLVVPLSLELEE